MYLLFTSLKNYFKALFRKLKRLILNRNIQKAVIFGASAVTVFEWGRICTRRYMCKKYRGGIEANKSPIKVTPICWGLSWLFPRNYHPMWGEAFNPYYPDPFPFDQDVYRVNEIMKFGYPGTDNVWYGNNMVISYNNVRKMVNWVYEHVTVTSLNPFWRVNIRAFGPTTDRFVHPYFRTNLKDYQNSGYQRYPLVSPLHGLQSVRYLKESYLMSNMVPIKGLKCWQNIERHVDQLVHTFSDVYCCSGTLFLPSIRNGQKYMEYELIGKNKMAVPTHLFKVVLAHSENNEIALESYMMPNDGSVNEETPLKSMQVDLSTIEKAGGLLFLNYFGLRQIKYINGRKNPNYLPPVTESKASNSLKPLNELNKLYLHNFSEEVPKSRREES